MISAVQKKFPGLKKVLSVVDGLKFPINKTLDNQKQNQFYNEWLHGYFINSIFVFDANGQIYACLFNAPGSWHDSVQADYGIYQKLCTCYKKYRV